MTLDTLLWLLPAVFMFHDFEEIIMVRPWLQKNTPLLRERFPKLAERVLPQLESLSTSAFALAVAEEFILLTALTLAAVEFKLYAMWTGAMLGFFFHLLVHLGQFLAFRKYIPAVLTSIPAGIYCIFALQQILSTGLATWAEIFPWFLATVVLLVVNLLFAHWLAAKFDIFLRKYSA
ncbi:MAG: HXXEE domain-containing protein [Chloroflexi bacterium]|nr:HXXEE domain-containing protein [Chloroflexota bacterium]